jgi:hypothetical protein
MWLCVCRSGVCQAGLGHTERVCGDWHLQLGHCRPHCLPDDGRCITVYLLAFPPWCLWVLIATIHV